MTEAEIEAVAKRLNELWWAERDRRVNEAWKKHPLNYMGVCTNPNCGNDCERMVRRDIGSVPA